MKAYTKSTAEERRLSNERRIAMDAYYIGPERRSGIDARGTKAIDMPAFMINDASQDSGFDWLFNKKGDLLSDR